MSTVRVVQYSLLRHKGITCMMHDKQCEQNIHNQLERNKLTDKNAQMKNKNSI